MSTARRALTKKILEEFPLTSFDLGTPTLIGYIFDEDESPIMTTFLRDGKIKFDTEGFAYVMASQKVLDEATAKGRLALELYQQWVDARWK